jgi:hypothetical protein
MPFQPVFTQFRKGKKKTKTAPYAINLQNHDTELKTSMYASVLLEK